MPLFELMPDQLIRIKKIMRIGLKVGGGGGRITLGYIFKIRSR